MSKAYDNLLANVPTDLWIGGKWRKSSDGARFDITDKSGKVIVAKDKRITVRHTRELEQSATTHISVPEDFLVGRVVARNIVDAETGEIIAKANDLDDASLQAAIQNLACLRGPTVNWPRLT